MRYVEHDPDAAHAAAQRCRDAAWRYEHVAAVLAADPGGISWWGCERDQVVAAAQELAADLRREASALRSTADELVLAARAAMRREQELANEAAAAAAAAAAAPCPPSGYSVGPSQPHRRATSGTSRTPRTTTDLPAGVR